MALNNPNNGTNRCFINKFALMLRQIISGLAITRWRIMSSEAQIKVSPKKAMKYNNNILDKRRQNLENTIITYLTKRNRTKDTARLSRWTRKSSMSLSTRRQMTQQSSLCVIEGISSLQTESDMVGERQSTHRHLRVHRHVSRRTITCNQKPQEQQKKTTNYIRTLPETMDKIRQGVKYPQPQVIQRRDEQRINAWWPKKSTTGVLYEVHRKEESWLGVVIVVNHCFTSLFGTNSLLSDIVIR